MHGLPVTGRGLPCALSLTSSCSSTPVENIRANTRMLHSMGQEHVSCKRLLGRWKVLYVLTVLCREGQLWCRTAARVAATAAWVAITNQMDCDCYELTPCVGRAAACWCWCWPLPQGHSHYGGQHRVSGAAWGACSSREGSGSSEQHAECCCCGAVPLESCIAILEGKGSAPRGPPYCCCLSCDQAPSMQSRVTQKLRD